MTQPPNTIVAIHITFALLAVVIGPFAIWARAGFVQRVRLHRACGHAWLTVMAGAATSALFIKGGTAPQLFAGFSVIHLLVPVTFAGMASGLYFMLAGQIRWHKRAMTMTYLGACVTAGVFTLLPNRYLGQLLWGQLLGS
jgi:uncharacterized membrane protein